MRKNIKKKFAPVAVALIAAALTLPVMVIALRAIGVIFQLDLHGVKWVVLPFLAVYALIGAAVFVGVLTAMRARLREIDSGEEDAARKY